MEKLEADTATLVLVNVDAVEPRSVVVQAGGYGEHRFESVDMGEKAQPIAGPLLNVRLQPGAGARLIRKALTTI